MPEPQFDLFADVLEFQAEIRGIIPPETPTLPNKTLAAEQLSQLREEVDEIDEAIHNGGTVADFADGLADLIYFALGMAVMAGIPLNEVWAQVHAKNMEKVSGPSHRSGHDALKPAGWTPPDHSWLLALSPAHVAAAKVRIQRGKQYNAGTIRVHDYFPLGVVSYGTMLHIKGLRLLSLAEAGRELDDPDVEDTAVDLMNYATFMAEKIIEIKAAKAAAARRLGQLD